MQERVGSTEGSSERIYPLPFSFYHTMSTKMQAPAVSASVEATTAMKSAGAHIADSAKTTGRSTAEADRGVVGHAETKADRTRNDPTAATEKLRAGADAKTHKSNSK